MFAPRVLHADELGTTMGPLGTLRFYSESDWLSFDRSCRLHLVDKRFLDHPFSPEYYKNATSDKSKLTRTFPRSHHPLETPLTFLTI
jgi:hypothetical protein